MDFDAEIDRLKLYMDAYIEVCFKRPEQRWCFPSFEEWKPGQVLKEERIYQHNNGTYIVAQRTYRTIYCVQYDVGPWVLSGPFERSKQKRMEWSLDAKKAIADFRADRKAEAIERMLR